MNRDEIDWAGLRAAAVAIGIRKAARQAARDLPPDEQERFLPAPSCAHPTCRVTTTGELPQRITHARIHGFADATFDFLFTRDLKASLPIVTQTNASDHWPVTRNLRLH